MMTDDDSEDELLEAAFAKVLLHPAFARYSREQLGFCETFCEMIRQAEHADVVELREELEEIAFETDDHNEASGFLNVFATLGGGFEADPVVDEGIELAGGGAFSDLEEARQEFADIPVQDVVRLTDWVIGIGTGQRPLAYQASSDALLKQVARIAENDREARLGHHQANILLYYALEGAERHLEFANYAAENLDSGFEIREQIPGRLWEAFNSRPAPEAEQLIEKWWGPKAQVPNDFFIALEWQRQGHIAIHRGRQYYDTVAEFLLSSCEPDPVDEHGRSGHGVEALRLDPFLEQDLYDALRKKSSYQWLISHDIPLRARYLDALCGSNALDRGQIVSALDHGIANKWDLENLSRYRELRELLSG